MPAVVASRRRRTDGSPPAYGLYVALVPALALLSWLALEARQPLDRAAWLGVIFWLVLGLVAHLGEIELPRAAGSHVWISTGFAMSAAAIAALPTAGAMVVVAFSSVTPNQLALLRRSPVSVIFNRGALGLCAAVAGLAYHAVYGAAPTLELPRMVAGTLLASALYFALNIGLVGAFVALRAGSTLHRAWLWPLPVSTALLVNYLALGLLGDLLVAMYTTGQAAGLILALLPLAITYFTLRRSATMSGTYQAIIATLVDSLDLRDHDTGGHTRRVAALTVRLGRKLGVRGRDLADLRTAALLHDLGKIGVADAILLSPAPLTEEERREMRKHPDRGAQLLEVHGLLDGAVPLIRHHQERFDGTGYPAGLAGDAIPFGSRIIAVADAFMAMVDGRPYRAPVSPAAAQVELERSAGSDFDPQVVRALEAADWEAVFTETPLGAEAPVLAE